MTMRHATANTRRWLHTDNVDFFATHRQFATMSTNEMGTKMMKERRVRHSSPNNVPANAKYHTREVFQASTPNNAKMEYSETVMLSVIMNENMPASAERLPIASTPASQNTRVLSKISSPDRAIARTPRA